MKIEFNNSETGEVVFSRKLIPGQERFWKAQGKYVLYSGGYGAGKTMILIMRVIYDCMAKKGNYVLIGRKTYAEISDVLWREFMDICHPSWIISYKTTPHPSVKLHTFDGGESELIFRNLDKMSEGEIKGLNLGGFAIDQAEDIPEQLFNALKGRLRRSGFACRGYMTANPSLSWLFHAFKKEPEPGYELIESSTLENAENLPPEYIADLKTYPLSLYKQFVLGIWDESLMSQDAVFAPEYLDKIQKHAASPLLLYNGLATFSPYQPGHRYQIGIDCSEGTEFSEEALLRKTKKDSGVIVVADLTSNEEAACYSGILMPSALAEKAIEIAAQYGNPLIVPEMNSVGTALVNALENKNYPNIYRRMEFDKIIHKKVSKYGFRSTAQSKRLLISRFEERLRKSEPKIHSKETAAEFRSFIWSNRPNKSGAGAKVGFHDDRVMATLLAFFTDADTFSGGFTQETVRARIPFMDNLTPSLEIIDGKYLPSKFFREDAPHWTTI